MIIALNAIPVHYIYENPPWFDRYPLRNVSSRAGRNAFALYKQQAIDALNQLNKRASLVINTEAAEKANEIKSGTMPTPTPEATIAPTPGERVLLLWSSVCILRTWKTNARKLLDQFWSSGAIPSSKSARLIFATLSSDGVIRFKRSKIANGYPDRHAMGFIQPKRIQVKLLKPALALALTWWSVSFPNSKQKMVGDSTMNLQRFDDGWKIVASHTSVVGM